MAINNRYARKVKRTKLYARLGDIYSCEDLDRDDLFLVQVDYEIESITEFLGGDHWIDSECGGDRPTAYIVKVGDGDYDDIYVSFDSRPYELSADYYQIVRNW